MTRLLLAAALIALPTVAASAQKAPIAGTAASGTTPNAVRDVTVFGAEKCPKSTPNEIVVCHREGAGEQYRIPKDLRRIRPSAANNSWVNRSQVVDQVGRQAAGLPDTCSAVGTGGQTGCFTQMQQAYAADRAQQRRDQDEVPQ